MNGPFQQAIKAYAPDWMTRRWMGTLLESVGATLDAVADRFELARSSGLVIPTANFAACEPADLERHAHDRGIRLYPSEPDASRRARLAQWRQLRRRRGTHRGEMEHAQPYFLPGIRPTIRIVHQAGDGSSATWHTLNQRGVYSVHVASPSNWDFDGVTLGWARAWAIVDLSGTRLDGGATYDDGTLYDGGAVYDGITVEQAADIVSIFKEWMSAHCALWGVILIRDSSLLSPSGTSTTDPDGWTTYPTGNWGSIVDPVTSLPTRDPRLDFIYDRGQMVIV